MRYFVVIVLFFASFQSVATTCTNKKPDVLFIVPNGESKFWKNKTALMKVSAKKLGINLTVYNPPLSAQNRYIFTEQINKYLSSHPHPDFIISYLWLKAEENFIAMLNNVKIPFISINSNIEKHSHFYGKPRGKYKYWLAHISPDDFATGYQLSKRLFTEYQKQHSTAATILAFGGRRDSSSSQAREKGLKAYLNQNSQLTLLQFINTNWTSKDAFNKMKTLIKRHPKVDIVWAANDTIAMGINDALLDHQTTTMSPPIIGGIDWLPEVLPKIKQQQIALTLGGHLFDGVWAQILLYDYFNGVDFTQTIGSIIKTDTSEINLKNINQMNEFLHPDNYQQLNIKRLSKCHNTQQTQYNFNIDSLI